MTERRVMTAIAVLAIAADAVMMFWIAPVFFGLLVAVVAIAVWAIQKLAADPTAANKDGGSM
jgi:hypothetical protein